MNSHVLYSLSHETNYVPQKGSKGSYCPYCNDERAWTQRESRSRDGLHAGKGPKFYRRSDEKIAEDINEALTLDPGVDASEIFFKVISGVVTLQGTVSDRWMKRASQAAIEDVFGVSDIKNELRISPHPFTS